MKIKTVSNFLLKTIFIIFTLFLAIHILGVFRIQDKDPYQAWDSFYKEPNDSLDAIFIGASNVFPFWSAPYSYNEYGHTIYPLSTSTIPARSYRYIIEETRKTQPNAKFILCLNTFKDPEATNTKYLHFLLTYMKMSKTKIDAVNAICKDLNITGLEKLEYYFPFIRFHSRWNELDTSDYILENYELKNAINKSFAYKNIQDVTGNYKISNNKVGLTDLQSDILNDLLDYIKSENIDAMFVIVPQALSNETVICQMNTMKEVVENKGYFVLDLLSQYPAIGLQLSQDFYNTHHINVHGSLKFTRYLGKFFNEYYEFEDKRGKSEFKSWDDAYKNYLNLIEPYTLDFEREGLDRNYSLKAPTLNYRIKTDGMEILWDEVEEATSYAIYRRSFIESEFGKWEKLGEVPAADDLSYFDNDVKSNVRYYYTVVPISKQNNKKLYGNFDYTGNSGVWVIQMPELKSIKKENDNGLRIEWGKVENADGYFVYRKINGEDFRKIDDISPDNSSYIDYYYQNELPYVYSVAAYIIDENGEKRVGTYNKIGLLHNESGIDSPNITINKDVNGDYSIVWETVKACDSYSVYYRLWGEDWTLIQNKVNSKAVSFELDNEHTIENAEYRVSAVITYDNNNYEYYSNVVSLEMEGD